MDTFLCLDCQQLTPTNHEVGTGYARIVVGPDAGHFVCYPCSDARERRDMARADDWMGYLSSDGAHVTTWPGGKLARVTREHRTKLVGFGGMPYDRSYIRAVDPTGAEWYGNGPGVGMYVRLHRVKGGK